MPDEDERDDTGWLPGPKIRDLPEFKGKEPGPVNAELTDDSPRRDIMRGLAGTGSVCVCPARLVGTGTSQYRYRLFL